MVMIAGNDVGDYMPVRDFAYEEVQRLVDAGEYKETFKRRQLPKVLEVAVRKRIAEKNEIEYLAPVGLTIDNYRDEGPQLGPETYSRIIYGPTGIQARHPVLGRRVRRKGAHVSAVDGLGSETNFDMSGFWAIGSGQTGALGYLFRSGLTMVSRADQLFGSISAPLRVCFAACLPVISVIAYLPTSLEKGEAL
jgi:hypothetical protein